MSIEKHLIAITCIGLLAFWILPDDEEASAITLTAVACDSFQDGESGTQAATWLLENMTKNEIKITSASTNCGCTIVKSAPELLPPEGRFEIRTERRYKNAEQAIADYRLFVFYSYQRGVDDNTNEPPMFVTNSVPQALLLERGTP